VADPTKEPPALQPFLPLRSAAALAYTAATGKYTSSAGTLNSVARIIADLTSIFTISADHEPARVLPLEVAEGKFEGGGEELGFADGRPALKALTILHRELPNVVNQVRLMYGKAIGNRRA
jgi:hypothetical protein